MCVSFDLYVCLFVVIGTFLMYLYLFQGHELVLHVLYHLHSQTITDSVQNSYPAVVYEKFLLAVVGKIFFSFYCFIVYSSLTFFYCHFQSTRILIYNLFMFSFFFM